MIHFPTIETDRMMLQNVKHHHTDFIFDHFSDERVCEYLYDEAKFTDRSHATALVEWYSNPESKGYNRWILEKKEEGGLPIGTCGFHAWDRINHTIEIGYDLYPSYWGKGYMKEALVAVINSGFQHMSLNRIQAFVALKNERSASLLETLGFIQEGVWREKHFFEGVHYDHYMYSLLRKEW